MSKGMTNPTSPPVTAERIEREPTAMEQVIFDELCDQGFAWEDAWASTLVEVFRRGAGEEYRSQGFDSYTLPHGFAIAAGLRAALTTPVGDEVVERVARTLAARFEWTEDPAPLTYWREIARAAINSLGLGIGQ